MTSRKVVAVRAVVEVGASASGTLSTLFRSADRFYQIAELAVRRIDTSDARARDQGDALVAVVFAAAALERWTSDLASRLTEGLPTLHALGEDLHAACRDAGLKARLDLLVERLGPIDRCADAELLAALRNLLVHSKYTEFSPRTRSREQVAHQPRARPKLAEEPERVLDKLAAKGLVRKEADHLAAVATLGVARWACETAADIVHQAEEHLRGHPESASLKCGFVGFGQASRDVSRSLQHR